MSHSFETIAYQHKDAFVPDMIAILLSIFKEIKDKNIKTTNELLSKSVNPKKLEKLFKDRFGFTVEIARDLYVFSPAAVIPFFGDYMRGHSSHNFFKSFHGVRLGEVMKKIKEIERNKINQLKKADKKEGWINLKQARVGGYLAELRNYLLLDFVWMYKNGFDEGEVAAIITHELGHIFDGMEEHYRLETTNRAIFDILCDIRDSQEERAIYKFNNTFTKDQFKKAQFDTDAERQDFCSELAMKYLDGGIKSQYIDGKYDETNFENMADTFAARFGLGKEIVSGLHKIHMLGGHTLPRNLLGYTVSTMFYTLNAAIILLLFPPFGATAFMGISLLFFGKRNADMTYDLPIDRYQRVMNSVVNALKNRDLPKELTKDLLEQVYFIDAIIRENMDGIANPADIVADFLSPSSRSATYYVNLQQKIERQLNNPLFIKSAELRVL